MNFDEIANDSGSIIEINNEKTKNNKKINNEKNKLNKKIKKQIIFTFQVDKTGLLY